jgi:hypothetical protein
MPNMGKRARERAVPAALLACALLLLAAAPSARAIPFGADLNLPANVAFDCTVLPVPSVFGGGFVVLPSGQPTCTWMNVGTVANPQLGTFLAPVAGTVTRIQVRVGPVTGPMQVLVMRSFRDASSTASPVCCIEVGRTPVFTPAPNAVTTIDTALAVRKDVVPDPVNNTLTFDALALSVLAPNVPVPAFDTGRHDPADFGIPTAVVYHPAVGPGQEAFRSSGVGGFQVLMAADVTPAATGAGPAPAGAGAAPAAIRLVQPAVSVRNGIAPVLIRCDLATGRCTGTLRLQSRQVVRAAAAGSKARTVTYGTGRISIAAGQRAHVKVKLSKAGRRLVGAHRRAKVWINATVGGKRVPASRLTLKR